jgi:4-hydroxybenzoate polyprenyltransferase
MGIKLSDKKGILQGCLLLMRPANLPTAAADIIAGAAIVGVFSNSLPSAIGMDLLLLVLASMALYAGGVVLNDVFDLKIDQVERPERPIPSRTVPLRTASFLGSGLLLLGLSLSLLVGNHPALVALVLAFAIVLYNALAKHHVFFGPLVMGSCRGLNLLLGMSLFGLPPLSLWYYMLLPLVYIGAVTLVSRGEVHGGNRNNIVLSGILYAVVVGLIMVLMPKTMAIWLSVLPFLLLFILAIYRPLIKAYKVNSPNNIKKAVKAGVLSLVLMDATIATSASTWWVGLAIVLFLPLSFFLSKRFSVT